MKHILYVISIFLVLTVLASCTDKEAMRQRLDYVSQCNRADTVFTEAWLPTVDSLVNYFDRHGNANEKMMAHYLKGRVYCDIGDAPQALECYQRATELADTTMDCDFHQLMVIHGQVSEIFQKQNLPKEGATELKKAYRYAMMLNDTISSFIYQQCLAVSFYEQQQYDSVFFISNKLLSLEKDQKSISYAVMLPIRTALESHDFINAKKYIEKFNTDCFDEMNEQEGNTLGLYYAYLGRYYMETNKIDSTFYYFKLSQLLC
ncbi:MAG: tetratricopeptide repeat protein, partial [Prevotella sp.]|nr:tetratricopeptide repeat protein [Prevotella sp.]